MLLDTIYLINKYQLLFDSSEHDGMPRCYCRLMLLS